MSFVLVFKRQIIIFNLYYLSIRSLQIYIAVLMFPLVEFNLIIEKLHEITNSDRKCLV